MSWGRGVKLFFLTVMGVLAHCVLACTWAWEGLWVVCFCFCVCFWRFCLFGFGTDGSCAPIPGRSV